MVTVSWVHKNKHVQFHAMLKH